MTDEINIDDKSELPQEPGSPVTPQSEEDCRFTEGQMITLVRVRFPGNAKSFPFLLGKKRIAYGQQVVAMSDRGMAVGYINSFPYEVPFNKAMLPLRSIAKIATQEDLDLEKKNLMAEKNAENICLRLIEKHKLNMNLTHVELIQFGKKAVFYFNAPDRVDFRELVKELVGELKMRIELRQISVRDRTAALGGFSPCGMQNCCSYFLKNYGNTSIKMAKNQNLALMPHKINGVCGQIKCCIKFEDSLYSAKRKVLPKENSLIETRGGDRGKVTRLHILAEEFVLLTAEGKFKRYAVSEYDPSIKLPADWSFPSNFDNIVDETQTLIGKKNCAEAPLQVNEELPTSEDSES